MNQHTLNTAKFILCTASALFTALFAAGFAGYKVGQPLTAAALSAVALPVAVGLAMDISKFKFWPMAARFKVLSIVLLLFSWAASVAFFVGQSDAAIAEARLETAAYKAHAARVAMLEKRLALLGQAAEQNSHSEYWQRLDKAEEQGEQLSALSDQLAATVREGADEGKQEALAALPSAAFFAGIGKALGLPFAVVRGLFYALLALLIEVCALACIAATAGACVSESPADDTQESLPRTADTQEPEEVAQMRGLILAGHVNPTHAALRAAGFGSYDQRKAVIDELVESGALVPAPRNSWRLAG